MSNTVLLLRRNPEDLTPQELAALKGHFGSSISFIRTDPADYKEHLAECEKHKAVAVLLPTERPIPSVAMEAGYPHVAMVPDNGGSVRLGCLEPLVPKFKFDF